jgi:hypothetical protein
VNFWLAGNPSLSNNALAKFAAALHAILDSTSPAHAGFQVWEWWNPALVWRHHWAENSINPQQLNTAVAAARNAFNTTFQRPNFNQLDFLNIIMQPQQQAQPTPKVDSYLCGGEGQPSCQQ